MFVVVKGLCIKVMGKKSGFFKLFVAVITCFFSYSLWLECSLGCWGRLISRFFGFCEVDVLGYVNSLGYKCISLLFVRGEGFLGGGMGFGVYV